MGGEREVEGRTTTTPDDLEHIVPEHDVASAQTFHSHGAIPPVVGFGCFGGPSPSERAFGPKLPLTDDKSLRAHGYRMEAECLLTSKEVTSGNDAIAALDLLLGVPEDQQAVVVDKLSQRAFDNLLDRLADDQRTRLTPLVNASQHPQRKLKLWAAQHRSRARSDLQRYAGNFGDDSDQTDAQAAAEKRYERREAGVISTLDEVDREYAALLKKGDKLTVDEVDKLRARKDRELDVETEHNVNLVAENVIRKDGSQVVWSTDELAQMDAAFDKVPEKHDGDHNSVEKYVRRANRDPMQTLAGQYNGDSIDIYDNANVVAPGREAARPVEYTVTHEIGHEVHNDNKAAFAKFEKVAGWTTTTEKELQERGVTEAQIDAMSEPQTIGDKTYQRQGSTYTQVDAGAIPSRDETSTDRWKYSLESPREHFAEMYAMAVQTPEALYVDYVTRPAEEVQRLEELVREKRQAVRGGAPPAELRTLEGQLAQAKKVALQRRELFAIIRDVFAASKHTRAAAERLRGRGASRDAIAAFESAAAQVSTPNQIAELERKAMQ